MYTSSESYLISTCHWKAAISACLPIWDGVALSCHEFLQPLQLEKGGLCWTRWGQGQPLSPAGLSVCLASFSGWVSKPPIPKNTKKSCIKFPCHVRFGVLFHQVKFFSCTKVPETNLRRFLKLILNCFRDLPNCSSHVQ